MVIGHLGKEELHPIVVGGAIVVLGHHHHHHHVHRHHDHLVITSGIIVRTWPYLCSTSLLK